MARKKTTSRVRANKPRARTAPTPALLIHFLSDLLRKRRLQGAFLRDPAKTMKSYGLSRDQIVAIASRRVQTIATAAVGELRRLGGQFQPRWPFPTPPKPPKPRPKPRPRPRPKPKPKPKAVKRPTRRTRPSR